MQIDAICKIHQINIFILKGKEILIGKFLITTIKSLRDASVTTLHQFFNANIFNDIHQLWRNLFLLQPIAIRSIKSMSHLMSNQHIINNTTRLLPHRKS